MEIGRRVEQIKNIEKIPDAEKNCFSVSGIFNKIAVSYTLLYIVCL